MNATTCRHCAQPYQVLCLCPGAQGRLPQGALAPLRLWYRLLLYGAGPGQNRRGN